MIAKKTKILALAVVGMMCAVAIVGAAYAAFQGNASTYNEGNKVDTGYMTLSPNGATPEEKWAPIVNTNEVFSTYTYAPMVDDDDDPATPDVPGAEKKAYYFKTAGSTVEINAQSYTVRELGSKVYTIDNQSGAAITAVNFKATATAAPAASDFVYFLKVTIGETVTYLDISTSEQETTAKTLAIAKDGTATITVAIVVGYIADVYVPNSFIGPAVETPATSYPAIESANGPVDLAATSFAFSLVDAS